MKHLKLACLLLATTALFGCATSRSVVDIATPAVANGNGQKVFISVLDERRFELKPQVPEIPSLKEGEITDKSITERAIARKRNGYGMGLGDVLLPEGTKVSDLIAKSIATAYGQAGYRVVPSSEKTVDTQAITVHVIEFWSWMSPSRVATAEAPTVGQKAPSTPKLNMLALDGQPTVVTFLRHCGCPCTYLRTAR